MDENRKKAIENLKHPLNRSFLDIIIRSLNPGGVYGYTAYLEVFTREELVELRESIDKESQQCPTN